MEKRKDETIGKEFIVNSTVLSKSRKSTNGPFHKKTHCTKEETLCFNSAKYFKKELLPLLLAPTKTVMGLTDKYPVSSRQR